MKSKGQQRTDSREPLTNRSMMAPGESQPGNDVSRQNLQKWKAALQQNVFTRNSAFGHSIRFYFPESHERMMTELSSFGERVVRELEPLVAENDVRSNLPRLEAYDDIGNRIDEVVHHPTYQQAGDIIYGSGMMEKLALPGGMLESLCFFFLSSHAGEAGHNCPVACTAGLIRVLNRIPDFPNRKEYLEQLMRPSFSENFTAAQFVTEIQGGSDVGINAAIASRENDGTWKITGEKWFCSNADADLILLTARYDTTISGTRGLGLFLVPARLTDGTRNSYTIRRLKEKLGTRTLASAEIDFHGAIAIPMGKTDEGFSLLMEHVLHLSRIYNSFGTIGIGRRALQIALDYACSREAFGKPIISYPLVQEHLAKICVENTALLASVMAMTRLQDQVDCMADSAGNEKLLLRLLANINKYITARLTVDHVHHAIDILAGNGMIETFSHLPRLLRDSLVFENWEGTHNTLRMQILRDIHRYNVDELFLDHCNSRIKRLKSPDPALATIRKSLDALKRHLADLRSLDPELQTLKIVTVVDQMATISCAVHLLLESVQQRQTGGGNAKRDALRLFTILHMTQGEQVITPDLLRLYGDVIRNLETLTLTDESLLAT